MPEIMGENNISDGVEIAGNNVISKYGYYGKAAAWDVGDVHMKGGAGQMNTIYSWGTLKEAGIINMRREGTKNYYFVDADQSQWKRILELVQLIYKAACDIKENDSRKEEPW